jgi:predicted FMN-binding regulatory protein PaiB
VSTEIPRFKIDVILWHAIERLNQNHQPADLTGILEEMRSNGRMLTREQIVTSLEYLHATGQVTKTVDNQYAVA